MTSQTRSDTVESARIPADQPVVASWGTLFSSEYIWRAVAVTGGVALYAINVLIVATIMPSIVAEIGGVNYYAWSTTLFVVASILGSALTVSVLNRWGARTAYLTAMAVFMLGSLVCALAPSMLVLLAGRTVQGLSGGVLTALSYALIRQVFKPFLWPRAIALVSAMWGIATLCGPAIGGVFAEYGLWRWSFGVLLPVAVVQALIVLKQLARGVQREAGSTGREKASIPWLALALLVLSAMVVAVSSLEKTRLWIPLSGCVGGLLLGALAVWVDSRSQGTQMLPVGGHSLRMPLGVVYACIWLLQAGIMVEIYVPYFLQQLHGYGPLAAGYLAAVMAAGWSAASLFSSGRSGQRASQMLRLGPVLCAGSLLALAVLLPWRWDIYPLQLMFLLAALAGTGFGIGSTWPHLLTRVMQLAAPGQGGHASAAGTTLQLYGMAIGSALAGLVVNATGGGQEGAPPALIGQAALWLMAGFVVLPALAAVLTWRLTRKPDGT